jgi:hypothetical protein
VPFVTAVLEQPKTALHESVVQTLPSLQLSGVPAVQAPAWQVSAPLQTFPSAQAVPFKTGVLAQPVAGLQLSLVQTLPSLQLSGVPAVQVPLWQVSSPLQASPSAHEEPLGSVGFWQPATGSQLFAVHGSLSSQFKAVPAVHTPL